MITERPGLLILIGFFLLVLGVAIPLMNVLHLLEASFFLSFLSFASSTAGLFLGLIGAATYARGHKNK
jgi:hypothetical protein